MSERQVEHLQARLVDFDQICKSDPVFYVVRAWYGIEVSVQREGRQSTGLWTYTGWSLRGDRVVAARRATRKLERAEARALRVMLDELALTLDRQ